MLQGPEGSEVTLTVQPRGSSSSKDVKLARQPIAFNPVDSALCSSGERCPEQGWPVAASRSNQGRLL